MSKRNRPNAWDVSFPTEAAGSSAALCADPAPSASSKSASARPLSRQAESSASARKRPRVEPEVETRRGVPSGPKLSYPPRPEDVKEYANTVVPGENPLERDEAAADPNSKPIRALTDFSVFDPSRQFELISLGLLDEESAQARQFEAAGAVAPVFLNEEDAGQEDDLDSEDGAGTKLQRLRTSAIFRYTLDYTKPDDPVYIETQFSWFELRAPSKLYSRIYRDFYRPHRISQIIVSTALSEPSTSLADLFDVYCNTWDGVIGEVIYEHHLREAMPLLWTIVNGYEVELKNRILACPFVQQLHQRSPDVPLSGTAPQPTRHRPPPPRLVDFTKLTGNLDTAVLRPDKQNPTHVSPLVDNLAQGLFHEHLKVVGPPQRRPTKHALKQQQRAMLTALLTLLNRAKQPEKNVKVAYPGNRRLEDGFWGAVVVDGVTYEVGDCIIVEAQEYRGRAKPKFPRNVDELPENVHIADYCWFAKIIYIDQVKGKLHVQWYEHGSRTFLEEICEPQELFLWPMCDHICVKNVLGKATVYPRPPTDKELGPLEYFCRFIYNETDASFVDIDVKAAMTAHLLDPPSNCTSCLLQEQRDGETVCAAVQNGLSYGGHTYHKNDYALFRVPEGPAGIGRIMNIQFPKAARQSGTATVEVQLLERVTTYFATLPAGVESRRLVHERELVMTEQMVKLQADLLLQPCIVVHASDVADLDEWLDMAPNHFFVKYLLPASDSPWSEKKKLNRSGVPACRTCLEQDNIRSERLADFIADPQNCLRAFDPFGGVGAFALAMQDLGCVKLTHAVEIAPSAALTLKKNSPETVVYNQCSNIVFQYAVKSHAGKLGPGDMASHLADGNPLPKPPTPQDIDCLIAGFPCQPHSQLNMFRRANDRKSHLMLNLLSWVDFLKPKYCFFENVRGFLSYSLHARQAGRYRVEGGIKMGGLKFFVRALLAMGYQVRFALLQAGHYGAPQSRVRFFLVAARQGLPLPDLPQPTHDFPPKDALEIKFPNGTAIQPILTLNGTALFKHVSIVDAIGDLPEFDWKDPRKLQSCSAGCGEKSSRRVFECKSSEPHCGLSGPSEVVPYKYEKPRTSFQARARRRPTTDIQHYTRTLPAATVERVVNIPVAPGADYRQLNSRLWEWQNSHPTSAIARDGFRPGLYGRLDQNKWFHTTVTNVDPMAKQSYVIHPYCKRILTVRELARSQGFPDWFVFYSLDNSVKTLQRHIGNAVPWQVSEALARELREAMLKKWQQNREDAIVINSDD
ncbi:S-adenosyl-L-methionine-dependent methyltransferase [Trametes sanguinea]|nr:S-adenosyl-L-methionine-dependent methyltransferase [Trametes sanguinea]